MTRAIIKEHGNGFPDVGDYVAGDDGEVYRVVSIDLGAIQTGRSPGASSWVRATVELADWDDVDDDTEPTCSAVIEEEDDGDDWEDD